MNIHYYKRQLLTGFLHIFLVLMESVTNFSISRLFILLYLFLELYSFQDYLIFSMATVKSLVIVIRAHVVKINNDYA